MITKLKFLIDDPVAYAGSVTVNGWVRTVREGKTAGFIALNDGSCFASVQVVYARDARCLGRGISTGCAIRITGELTLTPLAPQPFEIKAEEIAVLGASPQDYPLQKKRHTLEYLRTMQHLRPRTNTFLATFRVRSVVAAAIHEYFTDKGFTYVHTPIITGSDCEGAGEMFEVTALDPLNMPKTRDGAVDYAKDFFGRQANLTVSGQLYGEAFALAFGDIYTFGPTFRAENSFTARHAAEFWMVEPEMAFCDLMGNMQVAEGMVKHIIQTVFDKCPQEMEFFNRFVDEGLIGRLRNVLDNDFERITYTEAVRVLLQSGKEFIYPVGWGVDLQTEHERYLTEEVYRKPVFVTDYPAAIKAFYMRVNDDGKTVAAMDLLVPGVGEIIGGSQREERITVLTERMRDLSMDMEPYGWYLDLRKYGGVYHAGFGLGFERIVMYVTGMANIRDVIPFPRTAGSLEM
ncbi:MAG: asparagine--tRNA ligase [Clostridiales bacterium]|nr:asparagine--tRNA ligase [Clostridiales bacterium]